jgi:hypothetical protein
MSQVGFELMTPLFERAKTVHTLDRVATVIGHYIFRMALHLIILNLITITIFGEQCKLSRY